MDIFFSKNIKDNPLFIVEEGFDPIREREIETILSLGNGYIGTRDSLAEAYGFSSPGTFVAGIYEKFNNNTYNEIVKLADWTRIKVFIRGNQLDLFKFKSLQHVRYLDLKQGISVREWETQDDVGRITKIRIVKFVSISNKNEVGKSISIQPQNYSGKIRVISGIDGSNMDLRYSDIEFINNKFPTMVIKTKNSNKSVLVAQKSKILINRQEPSLLAYIVGNIGYSHILEEKSFYEEWIFNAEIGTEYTITSGAFLYSENNKVHDLYINLKSLGDDFYNVMLESHKKQWQKIWQNNEILIDGDKNAQQWLNFSIYHIITAGTFSGNKVSIPARDLSGDAYKGHIFWDTEMYQLPFFILSQPDIARNLLMYRYNTLNGARENARQEGLRGAAFAWESTDSGLEMTPKEVIMPYGVKIKIYSGLYEHHISPDIAYAIWQYWQVTGDDDFIINYGAEIVFETARYCKSLMELEDDGMFHINKVVGPDEYHELVDDNAYTNIMAGFNLENAIKIADFFKENAGNKFNLLLEKISLTNQELKEWESVKDRIYTGLDKDKGLFEQFKGYFDLEYIDMENYNPRIASMDMILGREKIKKTQVVKQADVVMFLFLLANKFPIELIEANYNYYEPRTSNGSSLSPPIHSIVAARLGKSELAYKYFEETSRIDLNNEMGNAAGGIHIAALGGIWMDVVMGFGGLYIYDKGMLFDPHLPDKWQKLEFSVIWHGQKVNVQIFKEKIIFKFVKNLYISVGYDNWRELTPEGVHSAYKQDNKWFWGIP